MCPARLSEQSPTGSIEKGSWKVDTKSEKRTKRPRNFDRSVERTCRNCKKSAGELPPGAKLRMCTRCQVVPYCSRECAAADWNSHKGQCKEDKLQSPKDYQRAKAARRKQRERERLTGQDDKENTNPESPTTPKQAKDRVFTPKESRKLRAQNQKDPRGLKHQHGSQEKTPKAKRERTHSGEIQSRPRSVLDILPHRSAINILCPSTIEVPSHAPSPTHAAARYTGGGRWARGPDAPNAKGFGGRAQLTARPSKGEVEKRLTFCTLDSEAPADSNKLEAAVEDPEQSVAEEALAKGELEEEVESTAGKKGKSKEPDSTSEESDLSEEGGVSKEADSTITTITAAISTILAEPVSRDENTKDVEFANSDAKEPAATCPVMPDADAIKSSEPQPICWAYVAELHKKFRVVIRKAAKGGQIHVHDLKLCLDLFDLETRDSPDLGLERNHVERAIKDHSNNDGSKMKMELGADCLAQLQAWHAVLFQKKEKRDIVRREEREREEKANRERKEKEKEMNRAKHNTPSRARSGSECSPPVRSPSSLLTEPLSPPFRQLVFVPMEVTYPFCSPQRPVYGIYPQARSCSPQARPCSSTKDIRARSPLTKLKLTPKQKQEFVLTPTELAELVQSTRRN